jgi:hypothetical protein
MKELHKLEEYNFDTVKSFIDNSIEESVNIEFKASGALSKKDADKKEVSKDVAAFANSDGGIIVYGISEKNHKADSLSFIDGNIFTKEWLEQIISSTIKRNIPDLKIFPIRNSGKIEESIYVVQIPSSVEAPHLSRDKRFYRRAQFESIMMEEYEIRNLYGRKVKSKLVLDGYSIVPIKPEQDDEFQFLFEAGIINEGEIVESDYKVNIYFINPQTGFRVSWNPQEVSNNYSYTNYKKPEQMKISVEGLSKIYPTERLTVARFNFSIKKENLLENFELVKIEIRLFYSGNEDEIKLDLKNFKSKIDKIKETFNI